MKSLIRIGFKAVFTIAALALIAYFGWKYALPKLEQKDLRDRSPATVTKVYDGDTFEADVEGKKEKVRMLGIDTPEKMDSDKLDRDIDRTKRDKQTIKKLGELASDYTTRLIGNKRVTLTRGNGDDDRDKYGRLLRYVYLDDGTFVNKKIVEDGYANAYRRFKVSKQDELIEAESEARENKRGLWGTIEGLKYMEIPDSR